MDTSNMQNGFEPPWRSGNSGLTLGSGFQPVSMGFPHHFASGSSQFPNVDLNNMTDASMNSFQNKPPMVPRNGRQNVKGDPQPEPSGPRMSMKAYDRSTDSDIFSLGSAFKDGNLNIDDFFKNMSPAAGSVQTITRTVQGDDGRKITTITKTSSPRPIHGASSSGFSPFGVPSVQNGSSQTTDYSCNMPASQVQPRRLTLDRISQYEGVENDPIPVDEPLLKQDEVCDTYPPEDEPIEFVAPPSVTDTTADKGDDEIHETSEEFSSGDEMTTNRLFWRKRKPKKSKTKPMLKKKPKEKGNTGMTASEITAPGSEESKLPTVQLLVMNFNRMLENNREQFIETLFRAVKLDGVSVVQILCQLVIRKNLKLSSEEMREPESSATVLHVALLCNHEELAEYLIGLNDKDLIMSVYTKQEYRRQTALHVAVANGNQKLVSKLLGVLTKRDKKVLINTLADGSYFIKSHPDGQLCLSAAAWAGYSDMLVLLAKNGANFAMADSEGNTLLHRLMISSANFPGKMNYTHMVDKVFEAIGEWAKRCRYKTNIPDQIKLEQKQKQINTFQKLLNVQNDKGETPLVLAAELGSNVLVYLMNMEPIHKIPQTKLGSISWVTYDVTDITTLALGSYNKFSALHVLAHNSRKLSSHENVDNSSDISMLDTEPIKSLIEMKWAVYRWVYVFWMFLHLVSMALFTCFTIDEYSAELVFVGSYDDPYVSAGPTVQMLGVKHHLCVFIIVPLMYIILEFIDWFGVYPYSITYMRNAHIYTKFINRMQSEWVITGNGPYRFVCFAYSIFTIMWFMMYELRIPGQDILLSMALLFGWIFILFFTRGCRVTSQFSIMIQKMFFQDLMYFMAVYIVILTAFSISVSAMYSFNHDARSDFPKVMYQMMNIITDLDQRSPGSYGKTDEHSLFTKILLIFYAIVAVILLMNMLIAMMNTSYEAVRITKCNLCKQQQLSILLMLERRLFWLKCISRRSEKSVWHKEWEEGVTRAYVDVTTQAGN